MRTWVFIILVMSVPTLALSAPTSLDQAFHAALERDESVRQSDEQVVQASARLARVRGGLFPDLSFSAYHLMQPEPDDPIAREFSPPQQTTLTFTARQAIFRGFREFAGMSQQGQLVAAREEGRKLRIQELYERVAVSYFNVLSLEQDLKNLSEQVEIYSERVGDLRARTRRGESSSTELLSSQSTANSLQAEQRLVQGQLQVARETFRSLTGLSKDSELVDPALIPRDGKTRVETLDRYLSRIEKRPDIQAAIAELNASDDGILIARGAHFPTIDAVGNYYVRRPGFFKDINWDVSIQVQVPLFAGGSTQAQVREAASRNRESDLELARVRRLAEDEIRGLHESLRARIEHLTLLRQAAALSGENAQVSRREFKRGLVRSIDVQLALSEYRVARRALDQAHFAAQLDLLRLEIASGKEP